MGRVIGLLIGALTVHAGVALAQAPGVAGTWRLDPSGSSPAAPALLFALSVAGPPAVLHITQPANGTLVIESQINEGHVRLYKPGGRTSTPVGQGGNLSMTSVWQGARLVSEGRQESPAGTTTTTRDVREVLSLSPDGQTLTIEVTVSASPQETSISRLVYARITDVGPCSSWPTPCKK